MNNNPIQVLINIVNAVYVVDSNEEMTIDVEPVDLIGTLKIKIQSRLGVHPEYQDLLFEGKILQNSRTLKDYNIKNF